MKLSIGRKLAALVTSVCLTAVVWTGSAEAAQVSVGQGDTLWAIAQKNGTTVETIKKLNNLTSDNLQIGQVLTIPDQPTNQAARPLTASPNVSRGIADRAMAVLDYAKQYIGVRYRAGGESPAGFDCSGYVRYVFKNFGIDLVHTAAGQYSAGTAIAKDELRPGDLVFFNTGGHGINHSGIYIGNNEFIHASSSRGIKIDSLNDSYWSARYRGAGRIL
ncbi:C40 family peptidase [Desulforamulus putei]|uniref:C40 family peptidase n=1 Tax=Desulforamulus putei TaxID=74701 RepID=UPI001EE4A0EE|nr:LysM peptidoglycan-binding domain-containing C40 family peptidase [Desulforamulus putei]